MFRNISSWIVLCAALIAAQSHLEFPACIDDSDCVDLGHTYACFLYKCYPWKKPLPGQPTCSSDYDCWGGTGTCFWHHSVRRVNRGLCFRAVVPCRSHDQCSADSRAGERCCYRHCCPIEYYEAWKEFKCYSDIGCQDLGTGTKCCSNGLCCFNETLPDGTESSESVINMEDSEPPYDRPTTVFEVDFLEVNPTPVSPVETLDEQMINQSSVADTSQTDVMLDADQFSTESLRTSTLASEVETLEQTETDDAPSTEKTTSDSSFSFQTTSIEKEIEVTSSSLDLQSVEEDLSTGTEESVEEESDSEVHSTEDLATTIGLRIDNATIEDVSPETVTSGGEIDDASYPTTMPTSLDNNMPSQESSTLILTTNDVTGFYESSSVPIEGFELEPGSSEMELSSTLVTKNEEWIVEVTENPFTTILPDSTEAEVTTSASESLPIKSIETSSITDVSETTTVEIFSETQESVATLSIASSPHPPRMKAKPAKHNFRKEERGKDHSSGLDSPCKSGAKINLPVLFHFFLIVTILLHSSF